MTVFPFKIMTPEKPIYDGPAVSVTVAGADGRLTVLARHAPMVALLAEGPIVVQTGKETLEGLAGPGLLQVDREGAAVMIHAFRWAGEETAAPPTDDAAANDMLF